MDREILEKVKAQSGRLKEAASTEQRPRGMNPAGRPQLSVIIPSYSMASHITRCLAAVMGQKTTASFEVIVIDSSTDGTDRIVGERFHGAQLIHLPQRTGSAAARNIGIRRSRAPIVALLDADCIPDPNWVDEILKAHRGPIELVAGSVSPAAPHTLAGLMLFAIQFSRFLPRARSRMVTFAPSCNLSAKVEALDAVGLFPEEFAIAEDVDLCRRYAELRRGSILFQPAVRVSHINRSGLRSVLEHLSVHGYYSAKIRRAYPLRGRFLTEWPALIPLLVPVRYTGILWRLLRSSGEKWLAPVYVASTPLVLLGLACWARGFMKCVTSREA